MKEWRCLWYRGPHHGLYECRGHNRFELWLNGEEYGWVNADSPLFGWFTMRLRLELETRIDDFNLKVLDRTGLIHS